MANHKKQNASGEEGAQFTKLAGGVNGQSNVFECTSEHINKICRDLASQGLALQSTSGNTQISTLLKVLTYLGATGINTYEGTAAGYARLATRIQDLEDRGWLILSRREDLIAPDGLFHPRVARYILIGRKADFVDAQRVQQLEVQA